MIARRYQDLIAWQLADELKREVYALVDTTTAATDFEFRDQIKESASAAPTNISEGFGYYEHPQFAKHVRIARSELNETHNHLGDGVARRHWTFERVGGLQLLANRAAGACTGLLRHLTTTDAPSSWGEKKKRQKR